ncbi:hypothetical protein CR513_62843, partial [Mucuna pruriens]
MVTVCIVLIVAIVKVWELHQMNVDNPFLHGDLQVDMYMKLSLGFMKQDQGMIWPLLLKLFLVYNAKGSCPYCGVSIKIFSKHKLSIRIFLCQRKYTLDIIIKTGLLRAKLSSLSVEKDHRLALDESPFFSNLAQYDTLLDISCTCVSPCQNFLIMSIPCLNLYNNQERSIGMLLYVWFIA